MNDDTQRETGIVKWFNETKGYGFISRGDGKNDIFVHVNDFGEGLTELKEGEEVSFEVKQGSKGPSASNVMKIATM